MIISPVYPHFRYVFTVCTLSGRPCVSINATKLLFFIIAASRHIVFDYGKIAEFYAHSNNIIQNLMENSALVIIDFNKAIELGYVCLKKELSDSYLEDYSNDEK